MTMMRVQCVEVVLLMTLGQCVLSLPIVHAPWGALQGVSLEGQGGRQMTAYLGVPYALPPVGELRYERPQPHPGPGKEEVFVADTVMPACPQKPMMIGARETSEDCLKLDVYVPAVDDPHNPRPYAVMVFIHGGGLIAGEAFTHRPSKLVVDGQVIVVVIQYRLGVLGFLSSGDGVVPENLGLWDQNLALRWVKDNVQAFGGDPDAITIFGESAGSWSVGYHLLMPPSKGLFNRAIMQSGAPQNLDHYADSLDRKAVFSGLTDLFGCEGDSRQRLQCLKNQPVDDLMKTSAKYEAQFRLLNCYYPFPDGELIPRRLQELLQDPSFLEKHAGYVDLIVGFNNHEGSILLLRQKLSQSPEEALYRRSFFQVIVDFCFGFKGLRNDTVLRKVTEFFYRGADYGRATSQSMDPVERMYGDCLMNVAITDWARHLVEAPHSGSRYMYVLDHDFSFNRQTLIQGSHHVDELMLLFDNERPWPEGNIFRVFNKTILSDEERGLSAKLVDIWTTFAKTGDPSGPLTDVLGGQWPQFSLEQERYLSLSGSPRLVSRMGPYADRLAFWLTLLPQLDLLTSHSAQQSTSPREEL